MNKEKKKKKLLYLADLGGIVFVSAAAGFGYACFITWPLQFNGAAFIAVIGASIMSSFFAAILWEMNLKIRNKKDGA